MKQLKANDWILITDISRYSANIDIRGFCKIKEVEGKDVVFYRNKRVLFKNNCGNPDWYRLGIKYCTKVTDVNTLKWLETLYG